MLEIKYDVPIEVTEKQYKILIVKCAGIIVHRYDEKAKKYYIKVWNIGAINFIKEILESN